MTALSVAVRRNTVDATGAKRARFWVYGLLIAFLVGSIFPFYWQFLVASRDSSMLTEQVPPLLPGGNFLANAARVFDSVPFWKALGNSVVVSGTVTFTTVLFSTLAGFAFAKLRFRFSNLLLLVTIGTMMIPPQLAVVPLYLWMSELGWSNQLQTVILPTLVSAFGTFFMRQYLVQALPGELIEAARVDGASSLRVVWHVVFPAARPAMAVLGLLTFVMAWNDFLWPIIALNQQNPTVQVALNSLGTGYVPDQAVIMAGALLGTLPLLIAFLLFGKQIVGGIMQGAIKG
jgi:cellobiose transport system permease protein